MRLSVLWLLQELTEEVGVEPTKHVSTRLTGFEDRAPHRGTMLLHSCFY